MTTPPTAEAVADSEFVCDCLPSFRSACAGEPFYNEDDGYRYCIFHFPGQEKAVEFREALQRKAKNKDFDFRGVWFPDNPVLFNIEFFTDADLAEAIFNEDALFSRVTFSGTGASMMLLLALALTSSRLPSARMQI
jgi:hypothetical protein